MAHAARLEHDAAAQGVLFQGLANAVRGCRHQIAQTHTVEAAVGHHREHVAEEIDRGLIGTGKTATVTHEQGVGVNALQFQPALDRCDTDDVQISGHTVCSPRFVVSRTDGTQQGMGKHIVTAVQQ